MFRVSATDVWLRERYGNGRAYFPNDDGIFDFREENAEFMHLEVEGTPEARPSSSTVTPTPRPLTLSATATGPSTPRSYPGFSSVVSQTGSRRGNSSFSLELVQGRITDFSKSQPNVQKLGQTFVEMAEATANVLHVTAAAEWEFGEDHVVVTANGMEVKDCAGTQGLKFWNVNSQTYFTVPEEDLQAPARKRSRKSLAHMDTVDPLDFEELKTEMSRIHEKLDKVFSLTRDSPIPAGLRILHWHAKLPYHSTPATYHLVASASLGVSGVSMSGLRIWMVGYRRTVLVVEVHGVWQRRLGSMDWMTLSKDCKASLEKNYRLITFVLALLKATIYLNKRFL